MIRDKVEKCALQVWSLGSVDPYQGRTLDWRATRSNSLDMSWKVRQGVYRLGPVPSSVGGIAEVEGGNGQG